MFDEKCTLLIDENLAGLRADVILSRQSFLSRSQAQKLFQSQKVNVNNKYCKPSYQAVVGDALTFPKPSLSPPKDLLGYSRELDIVFEDQWVLVVNKPPDLVVHPAPGHLQDTLVNVLIHHKKKLSSGAMLNKNRKQQELIYSRPGIVHRIDKGTSGLLVIAKNDFSHQHLAQQFASHLVQRCYWALVFGKPLKPFGQLVTKIARHPKHRQRFQSTKSQNKGKQAITYYKVVQSQNGVSLLHLKLKTGRTHQIRVHLLEQNHPILGDWTYAKTRRIYSLKNLHLRASLEKLTRPALHAARLGFVHPHHQNYLEFEVGWPVDLLDVLSASGLVS